jgi:hypothetical protein
VCERETESCDDNEVVLLAREAQKKVLEKNGGGVFFFFFLVSKELWLELEIALVALWALSMVVRPNKSWTSRSIAH